MYMAREDLANMSNMTTSNAIRTLSQFASEGIISLDGRKIKLLDEQELTRISRLG
jgi:CRP-like cAMP-binding protein